MSTEPSAVACRPARIVEQAVARGHARPAVSNISNAHRIGFIKGRRAPLWLVFTPEGVRGKADKGKLRKSPRTSPIAR